MQTPARTDKIGLRRAKMTVEQKVLSLLEALEVEHANAARALVERCWRRNVHLLEADGARAEGSLLNGAATCGWVVEVRPATYNLFTRSRLLTIRKSSHARRARWNIGVSFHGTPQTRLYHVKAEWTRRWREELNK